ncbi:MAG: cupin domain-containing protein [Marinobacterium sp.]|nr:cupin domain-containing protein [Marinobacterium sp.]
MSINHHLDDATILSYAAGSLPHAFEVLVACHLRQCQHCRQRVAEAELLGGMLLEALEPLPLRDEASQPALLLADMPDMPATVDIPDSALSVVDIDWASGATTLAATGADVAQPGLHPINGLPELPDSPHQQPWRRSLILPEPLELLYQSHCYESSKGHDTISGHEALPWKRLVPGIQHLPLESSEGNLRLLKIAPGISIPLHSHEGSELTLILQGSYCDELGRFQAGDVADLDCDTEHQPITDGNEPCICLVATDAPLRFNDLLPRMLQPFTGF